ncbi:hypothetical protein D3C72_1018670 [compost metagenome]
MSGSANRAAARATRIRQPPENSDMGRCWSSWLKPRPARISLARAGAESASMSIRRAQISPISSGGAVSSRVSRVWRSTSASRIVSSTLSGVAGCS